MATAQRLGNDSARKFAYLSVADELPGISGSHFMALQNLPFPLAFSVCVSSNFESR